MNFFKELCVFNRITFVEKTHSYLIDGLPSNSPSVTKLLKKFKKEFDKENTAARVAKKTKTTKAHVLAEWEMNNLYSTTIGSMLHKYIENYYSNKRIEFDGSFAGLGFEEKKKISETFPTLVQYFQNFYEDNKHLVCVKNEMVLGDVEDTRVCGMMDMLSYNTKTDELEILDFKTNKKMNKTSPWGNLFYPFDDMTEGEINEYTIQLNCYKYFLEKYTSAKISKLKLVWFNAINSNYEIIELGDVQLKIKAMLDCFKSSSLFATI
jgi:hypothetical protein